MKITVISGSPRKGNTFRVIKQFEKNIHQSGDAEFSYIHLKDSNLQMCKGCFQCIQKGHKYCPLDDDFKYIFDKMIKSNGIIFAVPSYNFNVTALMKNFIDRFAFLGHQPGFFKQHLMIISTAAGTGLNSVINYLTKYTGKIWGFRTITTLGLLTPPHKDNIKLTQKDYKKINKKAKLYYKHLQSKTWQPEYYHIEQFCSMRAIFSMEEMKDSFPSDYTLYNSLKNKRFYFDTKVNTIKYILACIQSGLVKFLIKTAAK